MADALHGIFAGLFFGIPAKAPCAMPTLEELVSVPLPIMLDAEVTEDNHGQSVIQTGLVMPRETN
jgi:hypothetical protein